MFALCSFCAPLYCIDSIRMHLGVVCFDRILKNMSSIAYSVERMAPDTDLNLFLNQGAIYV